uniref:Uncharacterized protein n=1 Tax=Arundo donax TaxID=35708 RepID=A0A0A8ZZ69_ARUDO
MLRGDPMQLDCPGQPLSSQVFRISGFSVILSGGRLRRI